MRDRMHARVVAKLKDGSAQYRDASGTVIAESVQVLIDRNLMQNGAEGMFRSEAVGFTWRHSELASAQRGGVFVFGAEQFVVEDVIADDGHMLTAACMVQP